MTAAPTRRLSWEPPVTLTIDLIGLTHFRGIRAEQITGWTTDVEGGPALAEFAGRACYQSWSKPRAETATNAGYMRNILDVGHLSVLEHGTATVYAQGVSRALTHELIRHRHHSPSQLSQRFVDESTVEFVVPPLIAADPDLAADFRDDTYRARDLYSEWVDKLTDRYPDATRKQIREAARAVLPNATETKIVLTGNYRAWRHLISMRATKHADAEIRAFAIKCLRLLQAEAETVFADYEISTLPDGSEVASSPYVDTP